MQVNIHLLNFVIVALRRRSLMPPGNPNTSANMSITMDEVDEEAERRGRVQVQRRQSFAPLKPSTSSVEDVNKRKIF
jgi:hypothetical protein